MGLRGSRLGLELYSRVMADSLKKLIRMFVIGVENSIATS